MDDSMLALLEKSKMLNSLVHGFFAEAKVIPPEDFAFWIPNCFNEYDRDEENGPLKRFTYELKSFFKKYLEVWISQNKSSEEVRVATKDLFSVASFFEGLASEECFSKLKSGRGIIKILEPISNADFRFKRMGDLLTFNIYRPERSSDEEHSTGKKAVLALCRRKDRSNNQDVYELVQRVEITLGIPEISYSESGNGKAYSLSGFCQEIVQTLHRISIGIPLDGLISNYCMLKGDIPIGEWRGLQIGARLIHPNATNKKEHVAHDEHDLRDRAMNWRRGNLIRIKDSHEADFCLGEDLLIALRISVSGSLPQNSMYADNSSRKYLDEQFLIANVGSMVVMSLGVMMLDRHDKRFYEMNPIKR